MNGTGSSSAVPGKNLGTYTVYNVYRSLYMYVDGSVDEFLATLGLIRFNLTFSLKRGKFMSLKSA